MTKSFKDAAIVSVTAVIGITILSVVAMLRGIDGTLYMASLAVIGGIAGFGVKAWLK